MVPLPAGKCDASMKEDAVINLNNALKKSCDA